MTDAIVEVGPGTIRGPNDARADWVSAALECLDDDFALIGEQPVSVARLWREVMRSVIGTTVERVVLVCPTWWPPSRIDMVYDAARTESTAVVVLQRTSILRDGLRSRTVTVVEVAADFVVVTPPGADMVVVPRRDEPAALTDEVAATVGVSTAVLLDAPAGIDGYETLGAAIADRLRANGVAVSVADEGWVRRVAATFLADQQAHTPDDVDVGPPQHRNRRGTAALAGALLCAAALFGGFAVRADNAVPPPEDTPMSLLVEGRVGVKVPATWAVQRITSGPGSARVQIVSSDTKTMLHVTQSAIPSHENLTMAADALREALDREPAGLFVDFNPADRRGDRPAVTYREIRGDRDIAWTVLIDDTVRIAIGCQSPQGHERLVLHACDEAIRSAHAVF